jgi:Mrp family chromosome partitioning ATPase
MFENLNQYSSIKNVIGVVSGKGGVGKSFVTAMLAVLLNRKGYKVGILDADITGPSIPRMFGINRKAKATELGITPEITANNIKIMSVNLLLEKEDSPVIWRGPILANTVKQFWSEVVWEDLDYLFLDMPPGTGDIPLTVFQSIPLDGIVIVSSPQELVSMIVKKAYNMASMMNIPVLGFVENMSYVKCPECGKEIHIFGESKLAEISNELGVDILGRIPIDPLIANLVDDGNFERFSCDYLVEAAEKIDTIFSK